VGLKSLKSLNLTNGYPNNMNNKNKSNNNNNNKVKSKPLELYELAGKKPSCSKNICNLASRNYEATRNKPPSAAALNILALFFPRTKLQKNLLSEGFFNALVRLTRL
jgi:hypothetical protein